MSQESFNWNEVTNTPEEEYQALLRSLRRRRGFGLLFIRCSLSQGTQLIEQIKQDLPQKKVGVLRFEAAIEDGNFYQCAKDYLRENGEVDTLFVQGLEYSLLSYERQKREESGWSSEDIYNYSWKAVPKLLGNLNLRREQFRDHFPTVCFVFLLPSFALTYLPNRAPDFFDWRSGIFNFAMGAADVQEASQRVYLGRGEWENLSKITKQELQKRLLAVETLLEEPNQTDENKANLLFQRGLLLGGYKEHEAEITSYDRALELNPNDHQIFSSRGDAFYKLGRYGEALESYNHALKLEPDTNEALYGRSISLFRLDRYQESIDNLECALAANPYDSDGWYFRGRLLKLRGQTELNKTLLRGAQKLNEDLRSITQSVTDMLTEDLPTQVTEKSVKQKLRLLTDKVEGVGASSQKAKKNLIEQVVEAINCFDKALEIQPYYSDAYYEKAGCYGLLGQVDYAISNLKQAIDLDLEYREMAKTDADFDRVRSDDRFQALLNESVE
jgi:tetratricopeptide (TPR) repeat protein